MSVGYGVEVRNKFALDCSGSDSDTQDPYEMLAKVTAEKEQNDAKSAKDTKSSKSRKPKAPVVAVETKAKAAESRATTSRQENPLRTRQRNFNQDRPSRPDSNQPPRRQERRPEQDGQGQPRRTDRPRQDDGRVVRGDGFQGEGNFQRGDGYRGGRGGRGGGGERGRGGERGQFSLRGRGGADRDGKRQGFDRHSGSNKTGTKAMEKRQGGGAHNWGTVNDDIVGTAAAETTVATPAATGAATAAAAAEGNPDFNGPSEDVENQQPEQKEAENVEPTEQEPEQLTLDEWKAKERRPVSTFNVRKPGDGVDVKQWGKTYVLQKKDIEEQSESEEEEDEEDYRQKKNVLQIEFKYTDSRSGNRGGNRGGRGGFSRGGGMERRGRGGPRGGGSAGPNNAGRGGGRQAQASQAPMFGESDFPTLGGK